MSDPGTPLLAHRRSGVLLHPTSLPVTDAIGAEAHAFCDFLAAGGFAVWQMLPLNPRDETGSPYRSASVFALDPSLAGIDGGGHDPADDGGYDAFVARERSWLDDYALYVALRDALGRPWHEWPAGLRDRHSAALASARREHAMALEATRRRQYRCDRGWHGLRRYAHAAGLQLFGDIPFFVAHDSADVWARRDLFLLDDSGAMTVNSGVPPDYFAATGQLWGMPHYHWAAMAADGWAWWQARLRRQLGLFDMLRLDHFRGLAAAWQVPIEAPTAAEGEWQPGPGAAFLRAMRAALGVLPLVAEDLGVITAEVRQLREDAGLPGMRVLQFAFGGDADNLHLPHWYTAQTVAYTGTHDNNTLAGWWTDDCEPAARIHAQAYLDHPRHAPEAMQRLALASVARLAVLPMQDLLGLGSAARMNTPGTATGNWQWRMATRPAPWLAQRYRALNALYGRSTPAA